MKPRSSAGINIFHREDHYFFFDYDEKDILDNLPWGDKQFDVLIPIFDESLLEDETAQSTIDRMILMDTDWFETLGEKSEWLHDYIDHASVRLGRQKAVGDGFPMTAWHTEATTIEKMTHHIRLPHGASYKYVVYVLGNSKNLTSLVAEFYNQRFD